jgi:outer membrane protein TolC
MKQTFGNLLVLSLSLWLGGSLAGWSQTNQTPQWLARPLSLSDAINAALQQNGTILRGKSDLEAQYGLIVQTRAVAIPKVAVNGNYQYSTEIETIPFPGFQPINNSWAANIQLTQTIYQGGQISSALRAAKLTKEQALLQYQTTIADSLLAVRVAYYDVLLAAEEVLVEEASVKLLTEQWEDQKRRYNAGTVPRFNVLQAEVAAANEKPRLIQARNSHRIAKNNLVNQLGYHITREVLEDVPMQLTDHLDDDPYLVELPVAIAKALQNRSELAALKKQEGLRNEAVIVAKSGYKPTAQIFGGYGARSAQFLSDDPGYTIHGASAGAQVSWSLFDGFYTKGKIEQAQALYKFHRGAGNFGIPKESGGRGGGGLAAGHGAQRRGDRHAIGCAGRANFTDAIAFHAGAGTA